MRGRRGGSVGDVNIRLDRTTANIFAGAVMVVALGGWLLEWSIYATVFCMAVVSSIGVVAVLPSPHPRHTAAATTPLVDVTSFEFHIVFGICIMVTLYLAESAEGWGISIPVPPDMLTLTLSNVVAENFVVTLVDITSTVYRSVFVNTSSRRAGFEDAAHKSERISGA
jgi:hypothetical protein